MKNIGAWTPTFQSASDPSNSASEPPYSLADSSKLEKIYFASLNCQKKINYLITDDGVARGCIVSVRKVTGFVDRHYIKSLNDPGIEVIICQSPLQPGLEFFHF
jgi:DeoR/GlpR family transcriptional regulator of sugar metabolism